MPTHRLTAGSTKVENLSLGENQAKLCPEETRTTEDT